MKRKILCLLLVLIFTNKNIVQSTVTSPDKKLIAAIWVKNRQVFYTVSIKDQPLLISSPITISKI